MKNLFKVALFMGTLLIYQRIIASTPWVQINTLNSNIPNNTINGIDLDSAGSVWVATNDGFGKYTGNNQWQIFHTPGAFQDVCLDLLVQDSIVWVATVNGLVRYCNGQINVFRPPGPNINATYFTSLSVESNILWCGTLGCGVFSFDGMTFSNYHSSNTGGFPMEDIRDIYVDRQGTKWISCNYSLSVGPLIAYVVTIDDAFSMNLYDSTNSTIKFTPNYISADINDVIYITDGSGYVSIYDGSTWSGFDGNVILPSVNFISSPFSFNQLNDTWAPSHSGIGIYSNSQWNLIDTIICPFGNAITTCTKIVFDNSGNVIIGTLGSGLLLYNPNGVTLTTSSVYEDQIFIASDANTLTIRLKNYSTVTNYYIVSMGGSVIQQGVFNLRLSDMTIDISYLEKNVYALMLIVDNKSYSTKFIKY